MSDRGPGIPEDKLKEVFEPFFTSKAEGMGMGLSIARTIVEAHHGQIWAKNRDHGGAYIPDQASSCPIVGGPARPIRSRPDFRCWGTFQTSRNVRCSVVIKGETDIANVDHARLCTLVHDPAV